MYDDYEYDVEYFKMRLVNIDIVSNVKNLRCIDFEEMLNKINILILMIICILCGWLWVIFCIWRKCIYIDKGF